MNTPAPVVATDNADDLSALFGKSDDPAALANQKRLETENLNAGSSEAIPFDLDAEVIALGEIALWQDKQDGMPGTQYNEFFTARSRDFSRSNPIALYIKEKNNYLVVGLQSRACVIDEAGNVMNRLVAIGKVSNDGDYQVVLLSDQVRSFYGAYARVAKQLQLTNQNVTRANVMSILETFHRNAQNLAQRAKSRVVSDHVAHKTAEEFETAAGPQAEDLKTGTEG
jgi:hypothetical protein